MLWKAERYELITHIAKLIVPIYEKRHEYPVKYWQRFVQRVSSLAWIVFESFSFKRWIDFSLYHSRALILRSSNLFSVM